MRYLIVFIFAAKLLGIGTVHAQECERLYSQGLNTTCRAVQTPTVSHVSLEAVAVTYPTTPEYDYCRLDFVAKGDFAEFRQEYAAVESGTVQLGRGVFLSRGGYNNRSPAVPLEWTDGTLRAAFNGWGFEKGWQDRITNEYLNKYGLKFLQEPLEELTRVIAFGAVIVENGREENRKQHLRLRVNRRVRYVAIHTFAIVPATHGVWDNAGK